MSKFQFQFQFQFQIFKQGYGIRLELPATIWLLQVSSCNVLDVRILLSAFVALAAVPWQCIQMCPWTFGNVFSILGLNIEAESRSKIHPHAFLPSARFHDQLWSHERWPQSGTLQQWPFYASHVGGDCWLTKPQISAASFAVSGQASRLSLSFSNVCFSSFHHDSNAQKDDLL